jgi:N-acylneuraminate cytidylyltransferase
MEQRSFIRTSTLADDTTVSLVTLDALERVDPDGTRYHHVAQLMANCPLRNAEDIINSYKQFLESDARAQISVTRYHWLNPWWAMTRTDNFRFEPIFPEKLSERSQDLPDLFCPTGALWWAKTDVLRRDKTFYIAERTGWEMPWERAIDIDTHEDWELAEILLLNKHQQGSLS